MNSKKRITINKILSFLLVFSMILSMIPNIFANSNEFEQGDDPGDRFYVSFDEVSIAKKWDDKGHEDKRPSEIDLIIYGADTYDADESLWTEIETITLDKEYNKEDDYTWSYTDSLYLPYYEYYYLAEANSGNYYTEPVMLTSMVESAPMSLRNEYDVAPAVMMVNEMFGSITNKYIDPSEPVQFLINKVWEDDNNKNETRPEFIEVELYGTNTEGAVSGGELLETITLTSAQHTVVGNKNKWQTVSPIIKTEYKYFYLKEITNNENYTVSISPVNKVDSLNVSSVINTQQTRAIWQESPIRMTLNKIWANELTEDTRQKISIDIYGSNNDDLSDAIYIDSVSLFKGSSEIKLYTENSYYFSDNYKYYFFEEPVDVLSVDNGYYIKTGSSHKFQEITVEDDEGNQKQCFATISTVTNTFVEELPTFYEVTINNTVIPQESNVQFDIIKTWDDNNNEYNLRPTAIEIEIYGTNVAGATENGELLNTVKLTSSNKIDANIWKKTTDIIKTSYEYFYVKEKNVNGYTTTISPIVKPEITSDVFDPNNREEISTYVGGGAYAFTYYFEKYWDDNDNAAGERPEYVTVNLLYKTGSWSDNPDDYNIYLRFNLYEDKVVVLEDALNRIGLGEYPASDWTTSFDLEYEDRNYMFMITEDPVKNYTVEYGEYPMSDYNHIKYAADIFNTYNPSNSEIYNVNITNTIVPPKRDVQITKIWDDENNKYYTRPNSLDITVYQNGNVFEILTFTAEDANNSNNNVWEKTITVPKYDANGNEYIYTISEDETNLNLEYYYYEPHINQISLTAINIGNWLPPIYTDNNPKYTIILQKEIINRNNQIATQEDFLKLKLNINDTYDFPIVLKQLKTIISKGETSMIEDYEGYSGDIFQGILTNKGQLIFSNIKPGKYEISEIVNQYFNFEKMEEIELTEGAKLTKENDKYYITLSGLTETDENIIVKVVNKIIPERYYQDKSNKTNLFLIHKSGINHNTPEE